MDQRQDQAFKEAVDRKKAEAKERSEATRPTGGPAPDQPPLPDQQHSLIDDSTPQDVVSPREKNQGKGKKTADKWNQ